MRLVTFSPRNKTFKLLKFYPNQPMQPMIGASRVLPLSQKLFQSEFYLTHVGWEEVAPRQPYPHPQHPCYYGFKWQEGRVLGEFCLNLITQGEGEFQTKRGKQTVLPGQAFLCEPGEWHRHRPNSSTGWTNMWINFNGTIPRQWLEEGAFKLEKNLIKVSDPVTFQANFMQLVEAVTSTDPKSCNFSDEISALFSQLVVTDGKRPPVNFEPSHDPIINSVLDYIWNHNNIVIGVSEIAEKVAIHRRTLERHFAAQLGNTLLGEIHWCSLSRAALLLRETDARIKYIVDRSGFGGYQRLRLAFQKFFGVSPREYREYYRSMKYGSKFESASIQLVPSYPLNMINHTEYLESKAA